MITLLYLVMFVMIALDWTAIGAAVVLTLLHRYRSEGDAG